MKIGRLKKRHQFLDISNHGHKAITKSFVVFCRFDFIQTQRPVFHDSDMLVGYTVTKKLGNAVRRNRIKRRLRAIVDGELPNAPAEFKDAGLVIIGRYTAANANFEDLRAEMRKVLNWLRKQKDIAV